MRKVILGKPSMIRSYHLAFLVGLMVMLLLLATTPADQAWAQDLPGGSYQRTCRNCTADGTTLRCECSWKNKFSSTSLNYTKCQDGSIWNEKSKLMCTPGSDFPAGSYKQTCGNCSDDGSRLTCQCKYKGNYSTTSIYYGLCESQISNQNGKLKCAPRGSFKRSCGSIDWNEFRIQAICKTKKGKTSGTTLENWNQCSGDIANCDGHLNCGGCP